MQNSWRRNTFKKEIQHVSLQEEFVNPDFFRLL